jgi:dipeptidyl aminopeptidase/acylaminoacyl peptidase
MAQSSPLSRGLVALGWLAPLLFGCGDDAGFDYVPPSDAQLQEVQGIWNGRDLSAQGAAVVYQDDSHSTYQLRIYEHLVDGRKHYGAVTIPKSETQSAFPVVLFADGLDQSRPVLDVGAWVQRSQQRLGQAVFVVPAFRGRTLIYGEMMSDAEGDSYRELTFDAEGDFCDAYDGATDDAIALLNVADAEVPQADFSRLMVSGPSRGGNVALLLAERDERVTLASAQSAPTDFYRRDVADHFPSQYRCQFLAGKTEDQARQRMLASSPLRFPLKPGVAQVYIDQGEQDTTVPLWNAREMVSQLEAQQVEVQYHSYPGYGHTDLGNSPEFNAVQGMIYETFLTR